MPNYDFICDVCNTVTEKLIKYEERDSEFFCCNCPESMLRRLFSSTFRVTQSEKLGEAVQWWVPDKNSPTGVKVTPHRNRYYRGIGDGEKK